MKIDWLFKDYEMPRIDTLTANLSGASFFLMKLLPARYILENVAEQGLLREGGKIVESTSGTFGLALAMFSAAKGYKLTLISDSAIDKKLYLRLKELEADVIIVNNENYGKAGGYQKVRLDILKEFLSENADAYWPKQYDNPFNPKAYGKLAEYLVEKLGKIDVVVAPVGSGGSAVGTITYLKNIFPNIELIGVDTPNSILFGQLDGKRLLRGLGNSIMPKNLNHTRFNYVSWVPASQAFYSTRLLHKKYGLFMGGTSGASFQVANWFSKLNPRKKVLALFPDEGHRYMETIYNDNWLKENNCLINSIPMEPVIVMHPNEDGDNWTFINWKGRKLDSFKEL